jgi:signal transduction histidine kinase
MTAVTRSSIATKLTWVNMVVTGAALVLAAVALGAYDRASFRASAVRNLSTQGQIAGENCVSALIFNDRSSAQTTLASLSASPNIVSAEIYGRDGQMFAAYRRDAHQSSQAPPAIPAGQNEIQRFGDESISVVRRIIFQDTLFGTIAIGSDYQELNARRNRTTGIIGVVLMASLLIAFLVSRVLQRSISGPIIRLAEMAKTVSGEHGYSVRAEAIGATAEMQVLVDAFNRMLTQIEERDTSLRMARDELEARVRDRTSELEATNKELEAFSYSVSHDLRAPLRHVVGFANLVEGHSAAQLDDQGRRYLRTIIKAATRMGVLIDDLLAFSRLGRGPLTKKRVSLNDLVRDARQEITSIDATGRSIDWQIDDLPDVDGDPALLRMVVINLLSNAVKYTSPRSSALIEVGTSTNGATPHEVVVFVRDNGVGFDMQYAGKLFGVFQRLHSSEEFEGTGIGLANVRRIINRHGGQVWGDSRLDHGATFHFSLPVQG